MKLAVFTGQYFWHDGSNFSTDEAFIKFVTSFHPPFEKIVFCDPIKEEIKSETYILDPNYTTVCPLPHFDTYSIWQNLLVVFPTIFRIVKKNIRDWDLVWLPGPHPVGLLFAYICRKTDTPFFQVIRANLTEQVRHTNRGIRQYMAVIVVSLLEHISRRLAKSHLTFTVGKEMYRQYAKRNNKVYETRISLVTQTDIDETLKRKKSRTHEPVRLLSVGRLDPEKGLCHLIEAVKRLVSSQFLPVSLQIIGKGYKGTEERKLRDWVKAHGLREHIHFSGYLPFGHRLLDEYRKQDIFILPSLSGEGVPQTIFEAMACGIPIIATSVAGIPYVIQDGHNGLLIEPGSSTHIAKAVERLISDRELRERLTRNGFATARQHTLNVEREDMLHRIENFLEEYPG